MTYAPPLCNFNVVGISKKTGMVKIVKLPAPSQKDANDFVADMQPNWIIVRGGGE